MIHYLYKLDGYNSEIAAAAPAVTSLVGIPPFWAHRFLMKAYKMTDWQVTFSGAISSSLHPSDSGENGKDGELNRLHGI